VSISVLAAAPVKQGHEHEGSSEEPGDGDADGAERYARQQAKDQAGEISRPMA
jgi:hypothetical protein